MKAKCAYCRGQFTSILDVCPHCGAPNVARDIPSKEKSVPEPNVKIPSRPLESL